ncbi:MAG TPA: phosphate ABC transporter permease PstA [Acidimicrobiia bacterium]|nr:phosphate ABC transporter permease PstA [Acidimicrobiia bacterium]
MTGRAAVATSGARAATEAALESRSNRDRALTLVFVSLMMFALLFALVGLLALIIFMFAEGGGRLTWGLITNPPSTINPGEAGFRTALLGTLYVIGGVVLLIVPLGIGAALYLEEYANRERWWNRLIELNIQNLAGVPSIVFGILGLAFIVRGPISLGFVAAAGSLTLALLVLPTVILASREAIRAVPSSIADGSLALGATQWQTIWKQILPAALPGILTGIILAVARAIGEAAPLLLVGAVTFVTFNPQFFSGGYSTLPVMIYQYSNRPQEEFRVLAAAGVIVMLVLVLVMNSLAVWLRDRFERSW